MNNHQQQYLQHNHLQHQRVQGGILPPALLTALDRLVDRLNGENYDTKESSLRQQPQGMIRVLLVGTNEGVGLSRSFGSASTSLSEEVISSIETMYATLPSSTPPHVMAAAAASSSENFSQPPHPLLSPLALGDQVKTVTAFYENCTLVHLHMTPLVRTHTYTHIYTYILSLQYFIQNKNTTIYLCIHHLAYLYFILLMILLMMIIGMCIFFNYFNV